MRYEMGVFWEVLGVIFGGRPRPAAINGQNHKSGPKIEN